jgi:putative transposase
MAVDFCYEVVAEALPRCGRPEFVNTAQRRLFTSAPFTGLLLENGIAVSLVCRGAWRDNVFVERLRRSVKLEGVYRRAFHRIGHARVSLSRYLTFYNTKRPHSSPDARIPARLL